MSAGADAAAGPLRLPLPVPYSGAQAVVSRPLVSIAIATYNGARYLGEQLETLYRQTWPSLEVVVSDDASTDGTAEILAHHAQIHGLRHGANPRRLGLVKNFERAISMCRGDYVALCDQDDLWEPHKVEALVAALGDHTLVYGITSLYIGLDGAVRANPEIEPIVRFARAHGSGRPTRYLLAENWVVSHSLLFRRELIAHAVPIPSHQPFHDGWLALVASTLGGIRFVEGDLEIYRQHPDSMTFPAAARAPEGGWPTRLRGRFRGSWRDAWRRRCAAETARLADALALPSLAAADRAFAERLLDHYAAGLRPGARLQSAWRGAEVAPFFATLQTAGARWKLPLRGLLGGL